MSVRVGPEGKPPEDEASGSNPLGRMTTLKPRQTHFAGGAFCVRVPWCGSIRILISRDAPDIGVTPRAAKASVTTSEARSTDTDPDTPPRS
jgi:hypothetical protein